MPFPQNQNAPLVTSANFVKKTVAYTALNGDFVIADTTTTAAWILTLPTIAQTVTGTSGLGVDGAAGPVSVRNVTGTNAVTVKTADGSTIDGVTGTTGIAYTTIHTGATFVSDGTNWFVASS